MVTYNFGSLHHQYNLKTFSFFCHKKKLIRNVFLLVMKQKKVSYCLIKLLRNQDDLQIVVLGTKKPLQDDNNCVEIVQMDPPASSLQLFLVVLFILRSPQLSQSSLVSSPSFFSLFSMSSSTEPLRRKLYCFLILAKESTEMFILPASSFSSSWSMPPVTVSRLSSTCWSLLLLLEVY